MMADVKGSPSDFPTTHVSFPESIDSPCGPPQTRDVAATKARRVGPAIGVVLAALGLSACQADSPFGEDQAPPTVLVVSPVYSDGNDGAQAQLETLQRVLDALRSETASGWTGRQDDLTGYLADLTGGRYSAAGGDGADAVIESFLDDYGLDLFGVGYEDLELAEPSGADITGTAAVRADQELNGVPVLDGQLIFTLDDPDTAAPSLSAVRGRAFPALSTSTEPGVTAAAATRTAQRLSSGQRNGKPRLVVKPTGAGQLAWEVSITGADGSGGLGLSDGLYYLDATTGDLIEVRPVTAERSLSTALPAKLVKQVRAALAADPNSVEISGQTLFGDQLTAVGVRTEDGVALVDTTVPTYDDATGDGAIVTFTAQDTENLPGRLYVERSQNGTTITDPEAIAAHAFSRAVYDYYASLGRSSWDGAGGTLLSTVNYGDDSFCNSFFDGTQMIYGNPCADEDGPAELTEVDVDTAGHEITHGVINTTANLVYSGQSGALNESFADYFGNVIGNRFNGTDSVAIFEGSCTGIPAPTSMCHANPDGGLSLRYMLNGNTYDDYLRLITPNLRMRITTGYDADNGGVHLNSAIWNNALWAIRTRLAQVDGTEGNDSKLASDFDKIVFAALTTQLGPAAGFLDARAAIEQVTVDAGADPTILRVAREIFDLSLLCEGCVDVGTVNGEVVSAASQTQIEPSVHGDQVTWIDLSLGNPGIGLPALSSVGGEATSLASAPETAQLVFAGDAKLALEVPSTSNELALVRYDESGARTVLGRVPDSTVLAGLAGSDEGAAWVTTEDGTVSFIDPAGEVVTADLPDLGGDNVTALGTGQGVVGLGTEGGQVILWEPGSGFTALGQASGTVFSVAAYGTRVLAVDDAGGATLFDGSGGALTLSDAASRFGAAVNADYAVWAERAGSLGGGVAEEVGGADDTDLYLYSFESGSIYNLLAQTGQQGYPAISGDRIVWQDTVFGGNDIMTATLPPGL